MASGYTVNTTSLAIRVGELNAVADSVGEVISTLNAAGGDLGPGEITAAVTEVIDQWQQNLGAMRDKIGTIADNVRGAVANYESVEQGGRDRMLALADETVAEHLVQGLVRNAPDVQVANQHSRQGQDGSTGGGRRHR
ncbi:hypothetical protein L6E12_27495 [Actinokineospora sp. PR83]|uniref:WXG100 family type VII secretion target n=1 Tax=Actinokineospora sp. PR83 TaxID=2884908 RepID=UPI001F3BE3C0|nr:hypothetical protein [Actinokineospora sp. PR83]MCG8919523.1 hypothetical protein [Actinokineospora sp. PR83]